MMAQENKVFEETGETIYKLNQNKEVRYWCEMCEEGQRILRTYESLMKQQSEKLAAQEEKLKKQGEALAESAVKLAEKDAKLEESAAALAQSAAIIAELQEKLNAQQKID